MSLEYQDELLKDINKDLILTNTNLKDANSAVAQQGSQMNKIQGDLKEAGISIKNTDRTMRVVEWRDKCYRWGLYVVIMMEFITIVVLLLVKIFK